MPQNNSTQEGYISLTEATKYCDYTQEYLSLRARQGKLKAVKFGRNWVTKKEWVQEYFGATNSEKAKEQAGKTQKAQRFLFSADRLFSSVAELLILVRRLSANLKIVVKRPELKYAVVGVLLFIFIGAGFVLGAPKLSVAKDLFVEGLVIFSEEVNRGVSKFSEDVGYVSDTTREMAKIPSVNIIQEILNGAGQISMPFTQKVWWHAFFDNVRVGGEIIAEVPLFAVSTISDKVKETKQFVSENFFSTRSGVKTVVQSFRNAKNCVINGAKNTVIAIAHIPPYIANKIFAFGDSAINRISTIEDSAFYGLAYTGSMFMEYIQWLNQIVVQPPLSAPAPQ
ncbi:hypothetical protein KAW43_03180 [Candidatus Parcubacteria bacterium]|nr:hypothetical protein [Candidatus Parcubacteria bacterium]